jgi:hypothetical protein
LATRFIMMAHAVGPAEAPLLPWSDLQKGRGMALGNRELMLGGVLKAALGEALAPIAKDVLSSLSSLNFTK